MAIRETLWYGKTPEQVKALDAKEFMQLVPARARRKLKRGFTGEEKELLRRVEKNKQNIKTHCRDMIIVPKMLGHTFLVYNGKEWTSLAVVQDMLGHALGEFSMTRKHVKHGAAGIGATKSSRGVTAK